MATKPVALAPDGPRSGTISVHASLYISCLVLRPNSDFLGLILKRMVFLPSSSILSPRHRHRFVVEGAGFGWAICARVLLRLVRIAPDSLTISARFSSSPMLSMLQEFRLFFL